MDVNLTTHRPAIAAAYAAYTSSPSLVTLQPLLSTLTVHQHLYQLSDHLRTRLAHGSPTAVLFFSNASPASDTRSALPSSAVTDAASVSTSSVRPTISFAAVSVASLEGELLSERIVKTFHILPPASAAPAPSPSSPASSAALPLIVESDWRTERNKLRGLGVFSYSIRVIVHVPLPLTADLPSAVSSAASTLMSPQYASFVLVDAHDTGTTPGMAEEGLMDALPVLMQMGRLSKEEFVWLLSVLCTFPSDFAFDVLSEQLMKLKTTQP